MCQIKNLLILVVAISLLNSCSTEKFDSLELNNQDTIVTIYKQTESNKLETTSKYGGKISKIELIGRNTLPGIEIISGINSIPNKEELILEKIKRVTFNDTPIVIVSIPLKNSFKELQIFKYKNMMKFVYVNISNHVNAKEFQMEDLNNNLIYSVTVNELGKLVEFKNGNGDINLYGKNIIKNKTTSENQLTLSPSCVESTSSFSSCMSCGISECKHDIACAILLYTEPILILAPFSVACSFA